MVAQNGSLLLSAAVDAAEVEVRVVDAARRAPLGDAAVCLGTAADGAQFGARASATLRGEQLRILLALMVLVVCGKLFYDLTVTPADIYSIGPGH